MFSYLRVGFCKPKKIRGITFLPSLVLFLSICLVLLAKGSGAEASAKATLDTKIGLENGTLHLDFSSKERELKLDFVLASKELHQTITSSEILGIFIKVNGTNVDLSMEFTEEPSNWNPTAELDLNTYQTRASICQEPGWKIVVVEKVKKMEARSGNPHWR